MNCPICDFHTDDPAEMFAHIGTIDRMGGVYHHSPTKTIAKGLGLNYGGGFPEASGHYEVGGLAVEIKPAIKGTIVRTLYGPRRSKSSAHRIYVTCPTCHKKIPSGRIHQHLIVHRPRKLACPICGKSYGTGSHLRAHKRLAHKGL